MTDRFHQSLNNPDQFTLTYELVPGRGGKGVSHERALNLAEEAAADGRLQAVSITENAGGHPVLSPEVLGIEIRKTGLDVIIHLSCKDKNRHQIESTLFAWDRENLNNLLVITGDYPQSGYRGKAKPVFDLDSIQTLDLICRLNCEQTGLDRRNPAVKLYHPTTFSKGVAVSPFKHLEGELMMQYYKLNRKVENGADYVITQIGYDARKFHELLLYMEMENIKIPVLGNAFIPNMKVAELMHKGDIPGCVIPDRLYEEMREEAKAADKGKEARLIRGAKLLSVLQGLGYAGAHIGGPGLTYKDISFMIDQSEKYKHDWRELVKELSYWPRDSFHLFEREQSGLNSRTYTTSRQEEGKKIHYSSAKIMHDLMFDQKSRYYEPCKKACLYLNSKSPTAFNAFEHLIKFILFHCRNCGDCTLAELAFLCPQSGCAKYLFNGACGGSRDGWCEVYPGRKKCLYVKIYERLKSVEKTEEMKSGFVPPRDWALTNTSSWCNFYKGIDHTNTGK